MSLLRCRRLLFDGKNSPPSLRTHRRNTVSVRCGSEAIHTGCVSSKPSTTTARRTLVTPISRSQRATDRLDGLINSSSQPRAKKSTGSSSIRVSGRNASSILKATQDAPAVATAPLPPPNSATAEAARAAGAREASLRAARLRRQAERQQQLGKEEKKEQAKKDYDKRYKTKARKWVSSIIAMPIVLVTSYYLFDRLVLGNPQKQMPRMKMIDGESDRPT